MGLLAAVLVLFLFPISAHHLVFSGFNFNPISRLIFWSLVADFTLLTWLGRCPAEAPFSFVALVSTVVYFVLITVLILAPRLSPLKF